MVDSARPKQLPIKTLNTFTCTLGSGYVRLFAELRNVDCANCLTPYIAALTLQALEALHARPLM